MNAFKAAGMVFAVVAGLYLLLPLVVFDFTSAARPYDEEYDGTREVAIGPKPYWWVPKAAWKLDVPGGFSYDVSGWPFVVWKPVCIAFLKVKGYAPPAQWRQWMQRLGAGSVHRIQTGRDDDELSLTRWTGLTGWHGTA